MRRSEMFPAEWVDMKPSQIIQDCADVDSASYISS